MIFLTQGVFGNEIPYFITEPIEYLEEFDYYSYQLVSVDPDSEDSLYYFVVEKPDWLTFTDLGNDTARLVGSPDKYYDSNPVIISVSDGKDTVSQEFNISILCLNCGPSIITEPITEINVNEEYTCYIEANDCNGNTILTADSLPNWLSSDNSELNRIYLTGIPSIADTGSHYVSILAEREKPICSTNSNLIYTIEVRPQIETYINPNYNPDISFYPNPFDRYILIKNSNSQFEKTSIEILNLSGIILYQKTLLINNEYKSIDLGFLIPDVYFIRITKASGTEIKKMIKVETH